MYIKASESLFEEIESIRRKLASTSACVTAPASSRVPTAPQGLWSAVILRTSRLGRDERRGEVRRGHGRREGQGQLRRGRRSPPEDHPLRESAQGDHGLRVP